MDKVVLVFTGDYWKLKNLPTETASLDVLGLAGECPGCRANAFALQGYLEAKEATNGFEQGMQRWRDTGLWWSQTGEQSIVIGQPFKILLTCTNCIAGHGLGG
jgi:hypothetical protein